MGHLHFDGAFVCPFEPPDHVYIVVLARAATLAAIGLFFPAWSRRSQSDPISL